MPKHIYSVGDDIVLKSGAFRAGDPKTSCRIVSVLPSAYGLAQYRIRYAAENCERRITEDDIDGKASKSALDTKAGTPTETSWINANMIRTRK